MIDIHNHLLPCLDDGPTTMEETLRMAQLAVDEGITLMVCTPHLLPGAVIPFARIKESVESTRAELAKAQIPLEIATGAEIDLTVARGLSDAQFRAYSIAGNGTWLLLEMPFEGWPLFLPELLSDLEMRGFQVVLAHPERARSVQLNPDRMRDVVGRGALVQVTAEALTGEFGRLTQQVARQLLANGLVHFIASDAHSSTRRSPGLRAALIEAADVLGCAPQDLTWMVEDGPRLLTEGKPVRPPRLGATTTRRDDGQPSAARAR